MNTKDTMNIIKNEDNTISTLELLKAVNEAREEAEEPLITNVKFLNKVEDELDDLRGVEIFSNPFGTDMKYYNLTQDQAKQVAMRESKAVRKWVVSELNRLYEKAEEKPKSVLEQVAEALSLAQEEINKQRFKIGVLIGQMKTVTEISKMYSKKTNTVVHPPEMNFILTHKGFQTVKRVGKYTHYHPTQLSIDKGLAKVVTGNTKITALHWSEDVLKYL